MNNNVCKYLNDYTNLLNIYRCFPKIEKKDILNILGLSLPTLNRDLTDLCKEGYLIYNKEQKTNKINSDFGYYVGVGVGSTQIKVVFLNFDFKPIDYSTLTYFLNKCDVFTKKIEGEWFKPCMDKNRYGYLYISTPKDKLSKLTNKINYIFEQLMILNSFMSTENNGILGIGMSFSGAVDIKRKIIKSVPNIPYIKSLNYECLINQENRFYLIQNNIPVIIDHNAKSAAVAEKYYLYRNDIEFSKNKNIAIIYFGFGISTGLIIDSKLYRGSSNFSGEIGHIPIPHIIKSNEIECCGCGSNDCLEFRIRKDVFNIDEESFKLAATEELIEILNDDEEKLELFIKYIGYAINYLVNILNIELVVFSGKLTRIYEEVEKFDKYFINNMTMYGLSYTRENCKYSFSRLGLLSSAIGAAIEVAYPNHENIFWPIIE